MSLHVLVRLRLGGELLVTQPTPVPHELHELPLAAAVLAVVQLHVLVQLGPQLLAVRPQDQVGRGAVVAHQTLRHGGRQDVAARQQLRGLTAATHVTSRGLHVLHSLLQPQPG